MIIQEVYVGRIPEIEEIFQEFSKLRDTYKVWKTGNTTKRTAKIEKLIEDLWGFSAFSLSIDPSPQPNAFTYPVATNLDMNPEDLIETTSKGYRYRKGSRAAAISKITKGLFTNPVFTDEEAFAIFLHEIGHSFVHRAPYIALQQDAYKTALIQQILYEIIYGIITGNPFLFADGVNAAVTTNSLYKEFIAKYNKAVRKIPILRDFENMFSLTKGFVGNTLNNFVYAILTGTGIRTILAKVNKYSYDTIDKKLIKYQGHQNAYSRSMERLSDDFATMYGFGPQLSTGLIKMENPDNQGAFMKVMNSIPIIGKLNRYTDAMVIEYQGLMGAHPSTPDRILSVLNAMETDVKKDKSIPDKVKKELNANIKKQKDIIKDIKDETGKIQPNRNEYLQALTVLGLNNGNTEDFVEKRYTDRAKLKKFYDDRKVRREQKLQEQTELEMYLLDLEDFF